MKIRISALTVIVLLYHTATIYAGSATWNLDPVTSKWQTPLNWTPETIPNGFHQTATFGLSNATDVHMAAGTSLDSIVFNPGASAFTFRLDHYSFLGLNGAGIVNNSGVMQTFDLVPPAFGGPLYFYRHSTAGTNTVLNTETSFGGGDGAQISFTEDSSADNATINVAAARRPLGTYESRIFFFHRARAGQAHFNMNGARLGEADGGTTEFDCDNCSAENATFTMEGGQVDKALGGQVVFNNGSHAANSILIANGGLNGGEGGKILFVYKSLGENARVQVYGNGTLDIGSHLGKHVTVGSIEGDGIVSLGANTLTVGSNNLDTIFSGVIKDGLYGPGGSLIKTGTGKLVLTRGSNYTGRTTIDAGELLANNRRGSATSLGPVLVNAGTLGGPGIIAGPVAVGTGGGTGAILAPGEDDIAVGTLTIQQSLSFHSDGTYDWALSSDTATADEVVAGGVTIDAGAQFSASSIGSGILALGSVFTAISNTTTSSLDGTFSNLADGSTITVGNNTFQASYEGGDGNDLTLTVVP